MSRQSFYLTTPIYYVNAVPHLGTAYTTVACDALARYRRMTGHDTFFLTGLDEHGQKVAQAAEENGMSPQEWCDSIAPRYREVWEMLRISNDDFIRTTQERHKRGVQAFWQKLHDDGYLYQGHYEGWYCVPDETYWAEGQLVDGKCPTCGRDVDFIREDNWFFKLSEFQDELLALYEERPQFVRPEKRRNEVVSFVKSGLKDLSISRTTFSWGVPLPFAENHVTYVWIDALLNYVTAVGYGDPEKEIQFERRWPAQVHFVGKDIIRFHCVIWPAMLMAAGLPLPEMVFAHGFLLTKGEKMSKSKGNVMSPQDLVERFGVDAYRYYFLRDVRFGEDGSISLESMVQRYNGDLANDWGNLCSRLFNMTEKYVSGVVPAPPTGPPTDADATLRALAGFLPEKYEAAMEKLDYGAALEATWDLIKDANRYIEQEAPWNLAKDESKRARLETVLFNALEAVRIAALFCAPVMPDTSAEVWARLGLGDIHDVFDIAAEGEWGRLPQGSRVTKGEPLFPRIYEDV
ncbi:MAG: methionine--tRNA ligase [Coriobacteriia bacterium]|nr:methionine--tRNA ligase [Coriobacteriia bacterium]